jgi:D-alanine transaminase/branched-chain amino acid aminotransferase
MGRWIFLNTDFVDEDHAKLHVKDLAIQRGYGIFDFFKVLNFTPVFLNDHLDRFYHSAARMRLEIPYTRSQIKEILTRLVEINAVPDCGIRLTLTGGYSEDGYLPASPNLVITTLPLMEVSKETYDAGITLTAWEHQRQLPEVKSIDYLMAIWLQPVLQQKNANDILYHSGGVITECPRSNFFIVTEDNCLVTPGKNILKGITRKQILKFASSIMPVEERTISLDELKTAKEAFITSTTKLILPVSRVDDYFLNNGQKPYSDKLLNAFLVHQAASRESAVESR